MKVSPTKCPGRIATPVTRRGFLQGASAGFGWLAFSALFGNAAPMFKARAKNVIFCFMDGGPSHVDTFDPKPMLKKHQGKRIGESAVSRLSQSTAGRVWLGSPWEFKQRGQSGLWVSELFPNIARVADKIAVVRNMIGEQPLHGQQNLLLHTGRILGQAPSLGAWVSYGLGTENENLPGFVVLQAGGAKVPHGGVGLFSNGYLPAENQGSIIVGDKQPAVRNIQPREADAAQRSRLEFVKGLDTDFIKKIGGGNDVEAAVRNYETAYRMQTAVPELCDLRGETAATKKMYGMDSPNGVTAAYGHQALLARRLVERGVRFVELSCLPEKMGGGQGPNPWDQHGNLKGGHENMARQVDQPIGGLLKDLKGRGLLKDTLVIWAGEFGRTPFSQGSNGRDHNPYGYSAWLAGGGAKGGSVYGATDELGYHAVEGKCDVYDLWATVLHLMGVDHEALTYRHGGRDLRLTDVHGKVIKKVVA